MAKTARQMRQLYALCATALVLGRADLDGADNAGFDIAMPISPTFTPRPYANTIA